MKSFFTDEQWQWVGERNREGYSLRELARFLGVHRETVRRGLVRRGMKPGDHEGLPPLSKQEFRSIAQTGGGA